MPSMFDERQPRKVRNSFAHGKRPQTGGRNCYVLNEWMDKHGADKFLRLMLSLNIYHRDLPTFARDVDIPEGALTPFVRKIFRAQRIGKQTFFIFKTPEFREQVTRIEMRKRKEFDEVMQAEKRAEDTSNDPALLIRIKTEALELPTEALSNRMMKLREEVGPAKFREFLLDLKSDTPGVELVKKYRHFALGRRLAGSHILRNWTFSMLRRALCSPSLDLIPELKKAIAAKPLSLVEKGIVEDMKKQKPGKVVSILKAG